MKIFLGHFLLRLTSIETVVQEATWLVVGGGCKPARLGQFACGGGRPWRSNCGNEEGIAREREKERKRER